MPAAARRVAISFGMVYIPVSLYTAVQEKGISFNQLTTDGVRIRQKKVREDTGTDVSTSDIVKGYEYARGQYVIITDDELERIKSERDKAINILHFTTPESIPSVYFDKSYLVTPDGSDKAYELLRRVMIERGVIAIAKSVLWSKENMMALIPEENGIRNDHAHLVDRNDLGCFAQLQRLVVAQPRFYASRFGGSCDDLLIKQIDLYISELQQLRRSISGSTAVTERP